MSMKDTEKNTFLEAVSDVQPIKSAEKVALAPAPDLLNAAQRRAAAVAEMAHQKNFLSGEYVEPVDPNAILEFKRDGVQTGVYRNLRLGKYVVDARLDLHHMTIELARTAVFQFIQDCMMHDIRCALITHGKGEGRQQPALLKSCIAHWLPQFPEILAFHSAQKRHGASGATYVLLRKSERKKLENREKHNE
jgi:DNA-nicking Smr family endonuclease